MRSAVIQCCRVNAPERGTPRRRPGRSGNVVLEFALITLIYVPLLVGVVSIGLNLGRAVQVSQIARDAASMYVRGIDFSQSANQGILVQLAQPLGMTANGGTGLVILSKITYITAAACTGIAGCNSNQQVLVQRLTVGNPSLSSGNLRLAGIVTLDSQGNVANYMTDAAAVVTGLSPVLTLSGSEFAYIAEAFFPSSDLTSLGGTGVYAVSVF
jgi:Flp pilus assembly protein TadG